MEEKQADLFGNAVEEENLSMGREDEGLMKSALQKCVRQGLVEPAMYWALRLAEKNSWICWRRLSTIADEDVGQTWAVVGVDCLYRKFMAMKKQTKERGLSWNMKRCVVLASKILAEAPKDRRADEFLELIDAIEKNPELKVLGAVKDWLAFLPDEAFDLHTIQGRKMRRGLLFWYEKSSRCENMTPQYAKWRAWWQELMVHIVKAKEVKKQ